MRGIDVLGIGSKNWNIKETIKAWTKGVAVGLFADETFGPLAIQNTIKLLNTGKVPAVRAHLNWMGPNPSHALPPLDKIKALAPKWEKLAKAYPMVRFYVSMTCEGKSSDKVEITKRLNLTANLCPSCTVVLSPWQSPPIPGYMLERHGKTTVGSGQIVSYDGGVKGEGLFDINAAAWVKDNTQAEIAFAWGPLCNMAEAHNTTPPNKRTQSPSANYLTSLIRLFDPLGAPPTPSFAVTPLKRPVLYKSHAEDSPGADARNNRPLFINKPKAGAVTLVTFQNQEIGKFMYYGGFPPDLFRFYSGMAGGLGLYGFQIADKAQSMSGSPYVWIKHSKKFYGPIHPTFRTPYYQA